MRKNFRDILREESIDELDKPLFGDEEGKSNEDKPFGTDEEMEVNEPEETIDDPTFTFEIKGNFNFNDLEKILDNNEAGLEPTKYSIIINTKGEISNSDHEKFVSFVEDKMKFFKFEE